MSTKKLLHDIETSLSSIAYPTQPEGLYEPIAYVLDGGGKRLRPTLLLLAYSLYRDDVEKVLPAAIGLETYHNHTLLHDDLMDKADMRRGRPTVHKRWDANTAILSGDTMLIMAFRHIMACEGEHKAEALELFARTAQEICEGQQYDINFETRSDVRVEEYMEMIRLKTAVFLACAVKMGALLAGASEADADVLYKYAESIGLAFQLQDDYLDVYGDPAVFGKKIGGDILCAKKTFLLINAFDCADEATRNELAALLTDGAMDPAKKIAAVTAIYDRLAIGQLTQNAINRLYDQAAETLRGMSLPTERLEPLTVYMHSLLGRQN